VESTQISPYGDSVIRVGGGHIDLQNAQDLATALSRVPGITMTRHNLIGAFGGGDGGAIYIRGHGSGRPGAEIVTYVDCVPKFSGLFSHPLLDMLPIDAAETIEVYKSHQSVLLGASGFGAMNLVPKRRDQPGVEGRVLYGLGSYDTQVARFELGARANPWDGFFVASHRDSDGHREDAGGVVDSAYGRVGAAFADGWEAHACVAYKSVDGTRKVAYGRVWGASRLLGLSGPEFVEGVEARSRSAQFSQVEHLRWLAAALTPRDRDDAVLAVAAAIH